MMDSEKLGEIILTALRMEEREGRAFNADHMKFVCGYFDMDAVATRVTDAVSTRVLSVIRERTILAEDG